jgi:hypothetical protein
VTEPTTPEPTTPEPTTPADEAKLMTAIVRLLDKADPAAQARVTAWAADRYRVRLAVGGIVKAGTGYIVGEKGPEAL